MTSHDRPDPEGDTMEPTALPTGTAAARPLPPGGARRVRRGAVAVLAAAALGACGPDANPPNNPPGMNVRVNDISVRYAHLEDPDAPGTGHRPGDDVALYLWFVNESGEPAALEEVSSAVASDVTLPGAQVPVDLPVGELLSMGPDDAHFVLQDITTQIRGAELVPVTLTFSDGASVEIMVQAVEVGPLD